MNCKNCNTLLIEDDLNHYIETCPNCLLFYSIHGKIRGIDIIRNKQWFIIEFNEVCIHNKNSAYSKQIGISVEDKSQEEIINILIKLKENSEFL